MQIFNRRVAWLAVFGAIATIVAQIWLRPAWRDEYYSILLSTPSLSFQRTITGPITTDVHPPLYSLVLHFWLHLQSNEVFARLLNLLLMGIAFTIGWNLRTGHRQQTAVYLFLCVTSFWFVFYGAEIRMLAAQFLSCMLSVLIARNAYEQPARRYVFLAGFFAIGVIAASLHFFGTLWVSAFGLCLGLLFLIERKPAAFFATGMATFLAILPTLIWVILTRPDQSEVASQTLPPFFDNLEAGLTQFLRGLIVKTFIANWPAWIAGGLGLAVLLKSPNARFEKTVLASLCLSVLIAFTIHLGFVSMIKERAFIAIIPAILYLLASGLASLRTEQSRAVRIARWTPYMAIVALPLFSTEYFKDREQYDQVVDYITQSEACHEAPILMYERPSRHGVDYSAFYTRTVTRHAFGGDGLDLLRISPETLEYAQAQWQGMECEVRAIALVLPRGYGRRYREMREELRAGGLPLDRWEEKRFGEGRSIVFVEPSGTAKED